MAFNPPRAVLIKPRAKTYYERWTEKEGVPLVRGHGIPDVRHIPFGKWKRLGCEGAYLRLKGLEGLVGAYVGRIAPGGSLQPEKHLYEKIVYIVEGAGVVEVQQHGRVPQAFEWRSGSLFSPPLNTTHRLVNHSAAPAVFVAFTTAPLVLDHFHNEAFVFNSYFTFSDRYDGNRGYFESAEKRYLSGSDRQWIWETNFIPDIRAVAIDARDSTGSGLNLTQIEICNNALIAHLAEWPAGRYPGAHCDGGAVLTTIRSRGFSLMWPKDLGVKPFENGFGSGVLRVDWKAGSMYSIPANWHHRHFNTGGEAALQLAVRCGSRKFPLGVERQDVGADVFPSASRYLAPVDDDDDPEIRRLYETELRMKGPAPDIPAFDEAELKKEEIPFRTDSIQPHAQGAETLARMK